MKTPLERIADLIALASSPNENEARTAALLAVQLIRKHRIQLTIPARSPTPVATRRPTPPGARTAPSRRRSTPKSVRRTVDFPEKIVAPLGGDCIHCGGRYRAEQTILWFPSGGGLHVKCLEGWAREHGVGG